MDLSRLFNFSCADQNCSQNKDAYNFDIPICESTSAHLPQKVINACISTGKEQRPINPHAQRLLTAQARKVSKLPTAKAAAKSAAKSAAKAKVKAKPGDVEDPPESKTKKKNKKTDQEFQDESGVSRTKYSEAKDKFMADPKFPGSTCYPKSVTAVHQLLLQTSQRLFL